MPNIILLDADGKQFSFDPTEYFIYPTHWSTTSPITALCGIQLFKDTKGTVSFGQLFVQKFGLRIEYTPIIGGIDFQAKIMSRFEDPSD